MPDEAEPTLSQALADGMGELAREDRQAGAEAFGRIILGLDDRAARDSFVNVVDSLGEITTPTLAAAVIRAATFRAVAEWPRWLDGIAAAALEGLADGPALIGGLVRSLWVKANDEKNPAPREKLTATLKSVERLVGVIGLERKELVDKIEAALGTTPITEDEAKAQEKVLKLADLFVASGLIRREDYAPKALTSIAAALEEPITPLEPAHPVSRHVERWGTDLASAGDDASRDRLRAAANASPWLQSPFQESLDIAGCLRAASDEVQNPYAEGEILTLVEQHLSWFDTGLAIWIEEVGNPDAVESGRVLRPFIADEIPSRVREAIEARFTDPADAAQLAIASLGGDLDSAPEVEFLEGIGIRNADPAPIMDFLITRYRGAGNNDQRKAILAIATAMAPLPDAQRKQLITEIVVPMAHLGKGAFDLVLSNLDACLPPPYGTVGKLRDTLRERAEGKEQRNRVEDAFLKAGMTRKSGPFGRGRKDVGD